MYEAIFNVQGVYVKAKGADSLLGQLGHVLDEVPAEKPLDVATSGLQPQTREMRDISPDTQPPNGELCPLWHSVFDRSLDAFSRTKLQCSFKGKSPFKEVRACRESMIHCAQYG